MLLSLLFFSAVVTSPINWDSRSPIVDAMTDRASSIVHVKVIETDTGDMGGENHDEGFWCERTGSASVVEVLKGKPGPDPVIYFKWGSDPEPTPDRDRLHKGGEYLIFTSSDRSAWWNPPGKPMVEIHYLIDPIVGFMPYDSFLSKMIKYRLKNPTQN